MKTSRCVLGALLLGGLFVLEGCGVGTYRIPNVEPVVKPAPEDDLLADFQAAAGDDPAPAQETPAEPPKEAAPAVAAEAAPVAPAAPPAEPAKTDKKAAEPAKADKKPAGAKK